MKTSGSRLLLALAIVTAVGGVGGCTGSSGAVAGDIAAVACATGDRSELCVVDLEKFELSRRVRLRSLALSIAADSASGRIVTAQCGGVGQDSDDAAGVFALDERRPDYIELEAPNPGDVAATDGYALLTHGFMDEQGLFACTIDVRSASLIETGRVPDGSLRPVAHADTVLVPRVPITDTSSVAAGAPTLSLLEFGRSLQPSTVATVPLTMAVVVEGEVGPTATLIGRDAHDSAVAVRVDLRTGGMVDSATIGGMEKGPSSACLVGDTIAVVAADAVDPRDPGREVVLLGREDLQVVGRFEVPGMPAAIAAWHGRLLVYDSMEGKLLLYEQGGATPVKSLVLQERPAIGGDVAVVESSGPGK